MASIVARERKDGTISYVAQIIKRAQGKVILQESRTFTNKKTAEAWGKKREKEIASAIEAGLPLTSQKVAALTLSDAIDKYVEESRKEIGKTKTQVLRTIQAKHGIAKMRCDRITSKEISEFAKEIMDKPEVTSASTVGNYLSHLSAIFKIAQPVWGIPLDNKQMEIAMTSAKALGLTGKSKKRERLPTLAELDALMQHFLDKCRFRPQTNPMHRIMAFAIFSTRRQEEITRIEWADYDEEEKRILVRNMKNPGDKIGNHVWVELPDPCCDIINAMPKVSKFIFPYGTDAISASFTRACKTLEIEDLHFHDLRHQGTTRLFELGRTLPQAASVTGHRSWSSLQRYSHIRKKGDKFEDWKWIEAVTLPKTRENP